MLLYFLTKQQNSLADSHEFGGSHWRLLPREVNNNHNPSEPEFICISYTWGRGRIPSQFHPGHRVSDRTIPVLLSLIYHRPACTHIWIDAFCIPVDEPARSFNLQNMGWIYSRATEVVVVLSSAIQPILKEMSRNDRLDLTHLDLLENDDWISRAWTYQEAVNSQKLAITCELPCETIIEGDTFLNRVGFTLSRIESSSHEKRSRYPRLDAFEDVIADWMIAGYQGRSALQVMANMDRRVQEKAEDHFYAMVGAISQELVESSAGLSPFRAFVAICEQKGDYSFIFSAAQREEDPAGDRWRPVEGDLPAILPWISWGESQPGHVQDGALYLEQIMVCQKESLSEDGTEFIKSWLEKSSVSKAQENPDLGQSVYASMQNLGWKGRSDYVSTAKGYFFPFERILSEQMTNLSVSTTVRWVFGAPGLACFSDGDVASYVPGVFVGNVDSSASQTIRLP